MENGEIEHIDMTTPSSNTAIKYVELRTKTRHSSTSIEVMLLSLARLSCLEELEICDDALGGFSLTEIEDHFVSVRQQWNLPECTLKLGYDTSTTSTWCNNSTHTNTAASPISNTENDAQDSSFTNYHSSDSNSSTTTADRKEFKLIPDAVVLKHILPFLPAVDMIRIRLMRKIFHEYSMDGAVWGYRLNNIDQELYIPATVDITRDNVYQDRILHENVVSTVNLKHRVFRESMAPYVQPKPVLEYLCTRYSNLPSVLNTPWNALDEDFVRDILEYCGATLKDIVLHWPPSQ
jgi:hypothetical protein